QGGAPNQLEVARHAGTDVKMASQVLGKSETKWFLRRAVDPADTRAKRLQVTPAEARLARRAIGVRQATDAEFFAPSSGQAPPRPVRAAGRRGPPRPSGRSRAARGRAPRRRTGSRCRCCANG